MKKLPHLNTNFQRIKERTSRTSLTIMLALFVFFILVAAIGMAILALYIFAQTEIIMDAYGNLHLGYVIACISVISLVIGGIIAFFSGKIPLKPINSLINKMNRLAAGDFKARLEFGSILSTHPAFQEISTSFNKMAAELENTELLRNDFINNLSHEFKTPIVSITGLARLLTKGNLTEEQKTLYLKSIEEESLRLSTMATNVLFLTKVENQNILTDVSVFNVSEQIRSALLLLEGRWTEKEIDLQLDFNEYSLEANEELLKQVWINLVDNAIKFSPHGGTVALSITEGEEYLDICVSNTGEELPEEKLNKLFNKFYQADESHATGGNGIGLAIVKRIVVLHNGEVSATCEGNRITFTVRLPLKQI